MCWRRAQAAGQWWSGTVEANVKCDDPSAWSIELVSVGKGNSATE